METTSPLADPRLGAALVGALVVALGWFVSGYRERRRDRRRRAERSIDVQTALAAEIQHYVDILGNPAFDLDEAWRDMVAQMDADDSYVPLIPSERNDTMFQSILPDVQILPEPVIRPVVRYYNQVFAIEAMIEDLRSEHFRAEATPQLQRIRMYTDYISMKKEALELGRQACAVLDDSLNRRPINSPGAARSDQ
ncbi:hypothetical protein MWU54_02315 [Marivita sp. S6314]|uniref:hypothetical protein n=1 Tax=Marivita sp. S6314 TaxID=2926406 RepID=UPI001FF531F4|nr:hypothetical protein [Marivita sp. S6314]MCK0148844.1 hypothetical protein [Marivita sp. S6314]